MKKILFAFALFSAGVFTTQGQTDDKFTIEKGTWNLTGSVAFGFSDSDNRGKSTDLNFLNENERTSIALRPMVGYAVGKNLITGIGLGYVNNNNEGKNSRDGVLSNSSEVSSTTYEIFPYVRGYFGVGKKLALYLQGEFKYSFTNNQSEDLLANEVTTDNDYNRYFFGIRPGLTWFVSNRMALETSLGSIGYSKVKAEFDEGRTGESKSFDFNLDSSNLLFGFSYYF